MAAEDRLTGEQTFTTSFLPSPYEEQVSPEQALAWLSDYYRCVLDALGLGFRASDEATRGAFEYVFLDLGRLHAACIQALVTQASVRIQIQSAPGHLDYDDLTAMLARVVAHRCDVNEGTGPYEAGFEWLAKVLMDRFAAAEEHRRASKEVEA